MSAIFTTSTAGALNRSQVWTGDIKPQFESELLASNMTRDITVEDGSAIINIPSIGQFTAQDFNENGELKKTGADIGNFTFSITEHKGVSTSITKKQMQDSFAAQELMGSIPRGFLRAMMVEFEEDIWGLQSAQTSGNANEIDGVAHRMVAQGSNQTISMEDFVRADLALNTANIPQSGRVAVITPAAAATLNLKVGAQAFNYNPSFEGMVRTGFTTGTKFLANIFGFDVYVSNHLATIDAGETIGSDSVTTGRANLFFSMDQDAVPFVSSWAQRPEIEGTYDMMKQEEIFAMTARWGKGLYREEGLVTVITEDNIIE